MADHSSEASPMFTYVDVAAQTPKGNDGGQGEVVELLKQMVSSQERQTELLEELVEQMSLAQKQRNVELGQWKQANPELARNCRKAAEMLSQVQTEFLRDITYEVHDSVDHLLDGDFMLNEFVDRFGPRLAHLNGILQVLSQLSSTTPAANSNSH